MKKMDLPPTGSDAFWQTPCVVLEGDFLRVTGVRLCRLGAVTGEYCRIYTFSLFFQLLYRGVYRLCKAVDRQVSASRQCSGWMYDTPENQALQFQLRLAVQQLQSFRQQYVCSAYQPSKTLPGNVDQMIRILQARMRGPFLCRVQPRRGAVNGEVQGYFRLLEWGLALCGELLVLPGDTAKQAVSTVGLPLGLLRALAAASPGLVLGAVSLPAVVEEALPKVHWDMPDVLVGSLGSLSQLEDNLRRNYYYVPARYIRDGDLPVRYIALYQSRNLFGEDAGIRYYGAVTHTRQLRRRNIDFPLTRGNGQELYYAFRVEAWKELHDPVAVRDEWVSEPRFTNSFLLTHARQTLELFNVHSAEQYRLLVGIGQALEALDANGGGIVVYRIQQDRLAVVTGHWITVTNGRGEALRRVAVRRFAQNPRREFRGLLKYM